MNSTQMNSITVFKHHIYIYVNSKVIANILLKLSHKCHFRNEELNQTKIEKAKGAMKKN